jgi:endo-1,4-beta-xylanase
MPPVFMAAGGDDNVSAAYPEIYRELKDAGASVELHIYAGVGHGFGLQPTSPLSVSGWPDRLWEWLFDRGLLTKRWGGLTRGTHRRVLFRELGRRYN